MESLREKELERKLELERLEKISATTLNQWESKLAELEARFARLSDLIDSYSHKIKAPAATIPLQTVQKKSEDELSPRKICEWLEKKKIPDEEYQKIAKAGQPLPEILYVDYSEGMAWAQMHIRGLDPDDTKAYNSGKLSFAELIQGHSIHVDLRMKFEPAFVQWVITQDEIPDYFDTLIGRRDPKTGNVSKGLAIVKPSAMEPEEKPTEKAKKDKREPIIDPKDAKEIEKYVLFDYSYIIEAGDVGACLSGNTGVLTDSGFKEIKYIKPGEFVFGPDGQFHKVLKVKHETNDLRDSFYIKFGKSIKTQATWDHPFLVAERKIQGNATNQIKSMKWLRAAEIYELKKKHRQYFKKKFAMAIPKTKDGHLPYDFADGIIVGFILGDGYIRRQTPNDRRIELYLNEKSEWWIASLLATILDGKGIELQFDRSRKHTLQFHILSEKYIEIVNQLLSNPLIIFDFKKDFAKGLIFGLSLSDGDKNINSNVRITQKKTHVNRLIPLVAHHADFLVDYSIDKRTNALRWHLSTHYIDAGDYILKSFDIEEAGEIGESYNLTVADVESYYIPFAISHNTPYKDAYMCCIWLGKAKAGVQREDLHEYFLYPQDDLPERNKKLFNGRFIIRCFKQGKAKRWWVWKATRDPYPMDSIKHCDTGHYWPIPAEELEKFGREAYREESIEAFSKKLKCSSVSKAPSSL